MNMYLRELADDLGLNPDGYTSSASLKQAILRKFNEREAPPPTLTQNLVLEYQLDLRYALVFADSVLRTNHGYEPASVATEMTESDIQLEYAGTTLPIHLFACWLNDPLYPERREVFKMTCLEWPMTGAIDAED